MGFLRKLFGGQASSSGDPDGLYYYVKGDRTGEVVQVRLHRYNDLSETDDQQGFYTRKLVVGQDHFERMEAEFFFDKNRRLVSTDVQGGSMVDREEYEAYRAQRDQEKGQA